MGSTCSFAGLCLQPSPNPDPSEGPGSTYSCPGVGDDGWTGVGGPSSLPRCPGHLCLVHCDTTSSSPHLDPLARGGAPGGEGRARRGPGPGSPPPRVVIHGSGRSETLKVPSDSQSPPWHYRRKSTLPAQLGPDTSPQTAHL